MTDTYGGEPPHDHDNGHEAADDVLTHEQGAVSEAPSDYEFADDHVATTEEHAEEHTALPDETAPAKRSPVLPIAAAAGGILLLGAVAWWQLFGGSEPPAPVMSQMPIVAPAPIAPVAPKTADADSGLPPLHPLADSESSLPVTPKTASAASDIQAAPVAPAPAPVAPAPVAVIEAKPLPAPVAPSAVEIPAQIVVAPVSSVSSASDDQRIAQLNARLDQVQKSLDQATQQLGQMNNMATAPGSTENVDQRLDKIEQQIATLKPRSPSVSAPSFAAPAVVHHHTTVRKPKPVATLREKPAAEEEAPAHWVLRAASPGQAWVSTTPTSLDLKELHVGDTLAGIGKVTAIRAQGMGWIVEGTKGQIQ